MIFKHRTFAFSLVELMIVIAIIGVLSAIAVPVYKDYIIKSKIVNTVSILSNLSNKLQEEYSKNGSFPTSINYNGVAVAEASWVSMNIDNTYSVFYDVSPDGSGVFMGANILNLEGLPGYVAPVGLGDSNASVLYYGIRVNSDGIISTNCGMHSPAFESYSPDLKYFPPSCQCANTLTFAFNGVAC